MGGHVAAIAGKQSASLPLDRWPHTPPRNEKALLLGGVELPVRRRLRLSAADCLQRLAGGAPGELLPPPVTQARPGLQDVNKKGGGMPSEPVRQQQGPSTQATLVLKQGDDSAGAT